MNAPPLQPPASRSGFTLAEVMISMFILLLVMAAAMALYLVYQNSWVTASLARTSSHRSSLAMERIVYGVGGNGGLREAQQNSVSVTYPAGGWRVDYNGNRFLRYTAGTQQITDESGNVLGRNILNSSLSYVTNGCEIMVQVRETGGRRSATNRVQSFVQFRN
jgi:prepilin-type N-terminal cleavage/methylation domain-containing protein